MRKSFTVPSVAAGRPISLRVTRETRTEAYDVYRVRADLNATEVHVTIPRGIPEDDVYEAIAAEGDSFA